MWTRDLEERRGRGLIPRHASETTRARRPTRPGQRGAQIAHEYAIARGKNSRPITSRATIAVEPRCVARCAYQDAAKFALTSRSGSSSTRSWMHRRSRDRGPFVRTRRRAWSATGGRARNRRPPRRRRYRGVSLSGPLQPLASRLAQRSGWSATRRRTGSSANAPNVCCKGSAIAGTGRGRAHVRERILAVVLEASAVRGSADARRTIGRR